MNLYLYSYAGDILIKTKAQIIFTLWQYKDIVPFGDLFLKLNITRKTWMGYIASSLAQTPRFSTIYQGSFGFEMRTGFVPGLSEFLKSLKPRESNKKMIQLERFTSDVTTWSISNEKSINVNILEDFCNFIYTCKNVSFENKRPNFTRCFFILSLFVSNR